MRRRVLYCFLLSGLCAGLLDLGAAYLIYLSEGGHSLAAVCRYIAAGLVGLPAATAGGRGIALLGFACHMGIAYWWVGLYFVFSPRKVPPLLSAALYGPLVWAAMTFIVLPLSKLPPRTHTLSDAALNAGVLIITIGLPSALGARRALR